MSDDRIGISTIMKRAVIAADSIDFYNRRLAWLVVPLTAAWLLWTFGVRTFLLPPSHALASESRDAGLQMTLVAPFPWWMLWGHSLAGSLLLAGVLFQKSTVCRMAQGASASPSQGGLPVSAHLARSLHHWAGYLLLGAMLVMSGAGLAMAPFSSWDNFSAFSVGFAAPWMVWAVALYVSAKTHKVESCAVSFSRFLRVLVVGRASACWKYGAEGQA